MFQKNVPLLVKIFAGLHYLYALVSLVPVLMLLFPVLASSIPVSMELGVMVVFFVAISVLINVSIARAFIKGKKWVRSLYIFISLMGTFSGLVSLIVLKFDSLERISTLVLSGLIAYYFIFDKNSRAFFSSNKIPLPPVKQS